MLARDSVHMEGMVDIFLVWDMQQIEDMQGKLVGQSLILKYTCRVDREEYHYHEYLQVKH
jgi:hypothetical protein